VLVSEGNVDESVVGKGAHSSKSSRLLTSTLGASGDEETSVLAPVRSLGPLLASLVPESLPLSGEVAVTCWDSKKHSIVLLEDGWVREGLDVGGLRGSVHLGEDIFGKGLGDPAA
jgi:hypothetical protein